jgi:hypothetical protein
MESKNVRQNPYPLRMPDELRAQLKALADADGRTLHNFILRSLADYARTQQLAQESTGFPGPVNAGANRPVAATRRANHQATE